MGYVRKFFLFGHPKRKRKRCPLLPTAREARLRGCSPLRTPKRRSRSKKAKKRRSAAFFFTLFHFSPIDPSGASRTPPPTNHQKVATNNRNCEPLNRRVLAPGRGQSVRSWILKGALAKRSRKARTQAPLSRASRAIGSSGTFFGSFWGSKRNTWRRQPIIKGSRRKVADPGSNPKTKQTTTSTKYFQKF